MDKDAGMGTEGMDKNGMITQDVVTEATGSAARSNGAEPPGGTLFLLNSLCMGGSEKKIIAVANALTAQGRRVHIAHLAGPETLRGRIDARVPVVHLQRSGKFSLAALGRLCAYVKAMGIRRLVAVNLYPVLYVYLACLRLRPRPAMVALINTSDHRSRRDRLFMGLYAPLLRRADQLVFGSAAQQQAWVEAFRLPRSRCQTILNGVDTDHFRPALSIPCSSADASAPGVTDPAATRCAAPLVIGTVGALRAEKAHGDLLQAAGLLHRKGLAVRVLLVGSGPCEPELRRVAAAQDIDGLVTFHGQADQVRPLLVQMDVFVMTSVAVETFSNAALEAMACGGCVIMSDIGGAAEMLVDGHSGLLYPPGDIPALAALLQRLNGSPLLRQQLGENARTRVLEHFSLQRMLSDYRRVVLAEPQAETTAGAGGRRQGVAVSWRK